LVKPRTSHPHPQKKKHAIATGKVSSTDLYAFPRWDEMGKNSDIEKQFMRGKAANGGGREIRGDGKENEGTKNVGKREDKKKGFFHEKSQKSGRKSYAKEMGRDVIKGERVTTRGQSKGEKKHLFGNGKEKKARGAKTQGG